MGWSKPTTEDLQIFIGASSSLNLFAGPSIVASIALAQVLLKEASNCNFVLLYHQGLA